MIAKDTFKDKAHFDTASALEALGKIWCHVESLEKGAQFLEESLKVYKEIFRNNPHPNTVTCLKALADAYLTINPQKANDYSAEAKKMQDQLRKVQNEL